jgi:endonuclease-3
MKRQDKADSIAEILAKLYPTTPIPLDHSDPFTLLVAVLLSAQTTDKKVNEVTPDLFRIGPDPETMAVQNVENILATIRVLGLAPTKAKNVKRLSELLVEKHGGQVPETFAELEALPGVGHKTASVVMSQAFGVPAFPVDTHIHRLAARWGLSNDTTVERTEADLKSLFPRDDWNALHLRIIFFGREYCPARYHDLSKCPICGFTSTIKRRLEEARKDKRVRK